MNLRTYIAGRSTPMHEWQFYWTYGPLPKEPCMHVQLEMFLGGDL